MSKRVSNKKSRPRVTPARSIKTQARFRKKLRIRKSQIEARKRVAAMMASLKERDEAHEKDWVAGSGFTKNPSWAKDVSDE